MPAKTPTVSPKAIKLVLNKPCFHKHYQGGKLVILKDCMGSDGKPCVLNTIFKKSGVTELFLKEGIKSGKLRGSTKGSPSGRKQGRKTPAAKGSTKGGPKGRGRKRSPSESSTTSSASSSSTRSTGGNERPKKRPRSTGLPLLAQLPQVETPNGYSEGERRPWSEEALYNKYDGLKGNNKGTQLLAYVKSFNSTEPYMWANLLTVLYHHGENETVEGLVLELLDVVARRHEIGVPIHTIEARPAGQKLEVIILVTQCSDSDAAHKVWVKIFTDGRYRKGVDILSCKILNLSMAQGTSDKNADFMEKSEWGKRHGVTYEGDTEVKALYMVIGKTRDPRNRVFYMPRLSRAREEAEEDELSKIHYQLPRNAGEIMRCAGGVSQAFSHPVLKPEDAMNPLMSVFPSMGPKEIAVVILGMLVSHRRHSWLEYHSDCIEHMKGGSLVLEPEEKDVLLAFIIPLVEKQRSALVAAITKKPADDRCVWIILRDIEEAVVDMMNGLNRTHSEYPSKLSSSVKHLTERFNGMMVASVEGKSR